MGLITIAIFYQSFPLISSKPHFNDDGIKSPQVASGGGIVHSLRFVRNAESFCIYLQKKYGGIVSIYLGGSKFNILSDHISGIAQLYKQDSLFSIKPFMYLFNKNVETMPEEMNNDEETKEIFRSRTGMGINIKKTYIKSNNYF